MACSASIALLLEILDIADHVAPNFHIAGGFNAEWRRHVWEGWLACNIVMVVMHLILISFSIFMVFVVKRFPTYYEYTLTKTYTVVLVIYIIVELGTSLYKYSWYGPNTFRLAFLVFTFLFWCIRTGFNVTGSIITYSRIKELDYEIQYGEKKLLNPYVYNQIDMRSGMATPTGMRTPMSFA